MAAARPSPFTCPRVVAAAEAGRAGEKFLVWSSLASGAPPHKISHSHNSQKHRSRERTK